MVGSKHYHEGVYYHFVEEKKAPGGLTVEVLVDRWILSIVRVLCIVRTDSGNGHAYLIEYIPHGETAPRRAVISQSSLLGRGEEALKELRDLGVSVLGCNATHVREYLDQEHLKFSSQKTPNDFWTSVKVIGWAPIGERFVLPDKIIGAQSGVWYSGKTNIAQYARKGEIEKWQREVATACVGNPYLIVALSCSFAGPLLEPLNIPGLGIHYFGDSTTGKSTSLAVAASAWGSDKFMISWRTTINGLEIQAVSRSSTLIPVDESHQVDPKALDASVYMLLNGTAKARMNKDTSPREIEHWHACVLSSGERSIETHQTAAKIDHKVGQAVRIIDVPVVNGQHGLFQDIHDVKNGAEFSDKLRDDAAKHYGHAGPCFIEKLIKYYPKLRLSPLLASTLAAFDNNLSAQDARVARSFAVIALAGELAAKWGILPWEEGSALIASIEVFKHWKNTQPELAKSKEHTQILRCLSDFIDAHGNSRFLDINWSPNTDPLIRDQAGYFDDSSGSRIYLFTSGGLREATKGFDFKRVIQALDEAGAFAKVGANQKSLTTRIPEGGCKDLYYIDPTKL
jgi:putative DNA primase/helicase